MCYPPRLAELGNRIREHRLNEKQRAELFELWKRGAPFPELACAVGRLMQEAVERAGGESEVVRGDS